MDARAFVVEHLANRSNLSADGIERGMGVSSMASIAITTIDRVRAHIVNFLVLAYFGEFDVGPCFRCHPFRFSRF